jgi:hypothetical protein
MTMRGLAVVLVVACAVAEAGAVEVLVDGRPAGSAPVSAGPRVARSTTPLPFVIGSDMAAATAETRVRGLGEPERIVVATPTQAYYRRDDAALAPAWVVDVSTANPWGVWRVFVDGQTGSIIRLADLTRDVSGDVFPTVSAAAHNTVSQARLPDLDTSGFLESAMVHVDDVTDFIALCPNDQLFCNPPRATTCAAKRHDGAFDYPQKPTATFPTCAAFDRFDQVTGYYQLARMTRYYQKKIGYPLGTGLLSGFTPLPVLANIPLLENAFFAPTTAASPPFLGFSDEFAPPQVKDFLRDPTIPRHEFTHAAIYDLDTALNDDFTCINNCSPYIAALNEAYADYFAIASFNMHGTIVGSQTGTLLAPQTARNIDNDFRFPCDLKGEPHDDGRIWSGFLREVRAIVGRGVDAKTFFSLRNLPHQPKTLQFADALVALLNALTLDENTLVHVVESAVRHGLIGPSSFDRSTQDTILSTADQGWTCENGAVCFPNRDEKVEGSASAEIDIPATFGMGAAAYDVFPAVDLGGSTAIRLFLSDSLAGAPGDLAIVLGDTPTCSNPIVSLPVPQHSAGGFQEYTLPLGNTSVLGAVTCVGLVISRNSGARIVRIDDVVASAGTRFGPVVVALEPGRRLALRNRFPAPLGDAHFYYFVPPAGATKVRVAAAIERSTTLNADLTYCGNVTVSATTVAPEFDNVFLWTYDPTQPALQFDLTPLPIDQHELITGVPTNGPMNRRLRRYLLPPSPSGIYAVSFQGAGRYRAKLVFE